MDIKNKNIKQLQELSEELRQKIIQTVSQNGGHLSPNIGAVELIVAMHYVFDATKDPFIFDVSHQSYAHKLLTDRWEKFDTLRTFGGISGYTKPTESKFDYFIAGHSSTSISLAVGAAKSIARYLNVSCCLSLANAFRSCFFRASRSSLQAASFVRDAENFTIISVSANSLSKIYCARAR